MTPSLAFRAAVTSLALPVLLGCAPTPDLGVQQPPAADVSAYRTFAIVKPVDAPVEQAIRSELEKRNYVYSAEDPDFKVFVQVVAASVETVRRENKGTASRLKPKWATDGRETMVVKFQDARRDVFFFRGSTSGLLNEGDPAAITRAVSEVLTAVTPREQAATSGGSPSPAP